MPRRKTTPGARAGKSPQKQVSTSLTEGKYAAGGAKLKKKRGGYMRKPKPPVHYTRRKKVIP